jgi:hypothetical protein
MESEPRARQGVDDVSELRARGESAAGGDHSRVGGATGSGAGDVRELARALAREMREAVSSDT